MLTYKTGSARLVRSNTKSTSGSTVLYTLIQIEKLRAVAVTISLHVEPYKRTDRFMDSAPSDIGQHSLWPISLLLIRPWLQPARPTRSDAYAVRNV